MTDKRLFGVVKGHREHITDHTGRLYSDSEVADLLNTVHEENEQIRIILSEYMQQIDKLAIEHGKLKGQLKIENYSDFLNSLVEKNEQLSEENKRLVKMLDNVANYMQKQHKDMPIDDFVEWWNGIATKGLDDGDVE